MLSCVFMPSIETFRAPRGSPFTLELRGLVGVCTPGWVTSSSTALRVANGSSKSCRPPSVLLTVALVACTISAPPTTSTVSVAAPISSFTLTSAGTPALTVTLGTMPDLKPGLVTTTLYSAAAMEGSVHSPRSFVVALNG